MGVLETPWGRPVTIFEQGTGAPVVFLHSGVGSAGEWRSVFECWPQSNRLIAVDAWASRPGPGPSGARTVDDFADQVHAVAAHVDEPIHLVGFSWGGATALRVATTSPVLLASLAVVEPECYSLLPGDHPDAWSTVVARRDRWRAHTAAGDSHAAFAEFIDNYNGEGSFAGWSEARRDGFLEAQRARGDNWDVLLESPVSAASLERIEVPTLVVEGGVTDDVERALCEVVRTRVPGSRHLVIEGAGHMIPLTHPEPLAQAVAQHVDSA